MASQKLKTVDVKGKRFDVSIDSEGKFFSEFDGEPVSSYSLKALISQLQTRMARQKRVNIPFCYWDEDRWGDTPGKARTGVILGLHGGNRNLLVKFDDQKKAEQFSDSTDSFVDLAKAKELQVLGDAVADAQATFNSFRKKYRFDGRAKVRAALGESLADEEDD